MTIRRRKTSGDHESRKYDFLTEVESERLMYIGAIALAWNWIEGAINTALAISLRLHGDMWVAVTSRINGMDGKLELLRKAITAADFPALSDQDALSVRKTLNAVEHYKKLRDGIIHVRLIHPSQIVADTVQRKGLTDEVLVSDLALLGLYRHLQHLAEEADWLTITYLNRWLLSEWPEDGTPPDEQPVKRALALLQTAQTKRERLPPLPEFPDPPPVPQA